jgi:hypothetical protein
VNEGSLEENRRSPEVVPRKNPDKVIVLVNVCGQYFSNKFQNLTHNCVLGGRHVVVVGCVDQVRLPKLVLETQVDSGTLVKGFLDFTRIRTLSLRVFIHHSRG